MQKYKLYSRIRDLREDKDMTQAEAAKIIKAGTTQYRRYELAETAISLEQAEKYANYYKVSLDYIAGRTNDKRGLTKSDLTAEETEILKKYKSLSEKRKGMLIERLDMLTKEEKEEQAQRKEAI
ncbi:MAG: helix-turn-helix transcriptional regulator [Oscillospiraceae bacterium]